MSIICKLCGTEFTKQINNRHLKYAHNITTTEYKEIYGNDSLSSAEYRAERSARVSGANNPMFNKQHSNVAKSKISNSNKNRVPYNKGIKVTDINQLTKLREGIKRRDENYKLHNNHPKLGKLLSDESKLKISNGVKTYAANNVEDVASRAKKISETKIKNNTLYVGYFTGHKHSEKTKQRISELGKIAGDIRHKQTIDNWLHFLSTIDMQLLSTSENIAHLKCKICNSEFDITVQYFNKSKQRADLCPMCRNPITHSDAELEIYRFISSINNTPTKLGNRSVIYPYELDIYCPDLSIAIEYCGLYWHSELQGKTSSYHLNKHMLCQNANIKLITIFEDEWIHHKDIVKSRLLNLLKCASIKIGARQCVVKPLDSKTGVKFFNNNHIQGSGRNILYLGLYYKNELVSAMSFARASISKGSNAADNVYELNRFCSKLYHSIPGAASKLLNAFIKQYNPHTIFSYSDKRWNTGNVYNNLGFEKVTDTPPNYWYIDGTTRKHRFSMRKNSQDNQLVSEWENRKSQGWDRIWDCGSTKWIWTKK